MLLLRHILPTAVIHGTLQSVEMTGLWYTSPTKPDTAFCVTDDVVQQSVCCLITGMPCVRPRLLEGRAGLFVLQLCYCKSPDKQWLHHNSFNGCLKVSL